MRPPPKQGLKFKIFIITDWSYIKLFFYKFTNRKVP